MKLTWFMYFYYFIVLLISKKKSISILIQVYRATAQDFLKIVRGNFFFHDPLVIYNNMGKPGGTWLCVNAMDWQKKNKLEHLELSWVAMSMEQIWHDEWIGTSKTMPQNVHLFLVFQLGRDHQFLLRWSIHFKFIYFTTQKWKKKRDN